MRAIHQGRVLYDMRGRVNVEAPGWAWFPGILDLKAFALSTERAIPCDGTTETDT